jgi:hypothetical protein
MAVIMRKTSILFFCAGLVCLSSLSHAARPIKKIKVNQPLAGRLMTILVETEALHRSLVGNEVEVEVKGKGKTKKKEMKRVPSSIGVKDQIKVLIGSIDKASQHSKLAGPGRVALDKILLATKARLKDAQSVSGKNSKQRTEFLKESFRQINQIARMYELDHKYKIFFCSKDRTEWIQSGSKAQHPFEPDGKLKSCGMVMR